MECKDFTVNANARAAAETLVEKDEYNQNCAEALVNGDEAVESLA